MAVQGVAHLGAQRVAGTQAGQFATGLADRGHQRVEHHTGGVPGWQQLVAVLTGIAGTAHPRPDAVDIRVLKGHVVHVGRQAERRQHLCRLRPLHGEHSIGAMLIGDRKFLWCNVFHRLDHRGGVGGVGHQEDLVVGDVVGDQVVDDTAGLGAAQGVLRLAGPDPAQVVGERGVDELGRARAAHQRLTEMADVEQADGVAGGVVLADRSRVGDGHQPTAELGEAGPQFTVAVLERAVQQVISHGQPD